MSLSVLSRNSRSRPRARPLPPEIVQKIRFHAAQASIFNDPTRFLVVPCGRRFGKTRGAIQWLYREAERHPGGVCWWVAPTYRQAKIALRYFRRLIDHRIVAEYRKAELCIELLNGATIWFLSADNPDSLLGEGVCALVVDEAGSIPEEVFTDYLRMTLADVRGRAVYIGSPRGKRSYFHRLHLRGLDPLEPDWATHIHPTGDNPFIDPEEIEANRKELPDHIFRQNIMAQFLDSAAQVFTVSEWAYELHAAPIPRRRYVWGIDLGKHIDYTVMLCYDSQVRRPVFYKRFKSLSWTLQLEIIVADTARLPGPVWLDATGAGDVVHDSLVARGVDVRPYVFTNESKGRLVERLALDVEHGDFLPFADPVAKAEIESFEFDFSRTGKVLYRAPCGQHDDTVFAHALVNWGLQLEPIAGVDEPVTGGHRSAFARAA